MSTAGSFGNHRSEVQASWTGRNHWRSSGQGAVECCNNEWTHWIPVMTITILWFTWSPAPCSWPPWSLGGLGSNRREPSQDFGKQDFEQPRPYYKCKAGTLIIPRVSTDGSWFVWYPFRCASAYITTLVRRKDCNMSKLKKLVSMIYEDRFTHSSPNPMDINQPGIYDILIYLGSI